MALRSEEQVWASQTAHGSSGLAGEGGGSADCFLQKCVVRWGIKMPGTTLGSEALNMLNDKERSQLRGEILRCKRQKR